jgi:hypothetical protein
MKRNVKHDMRKRARAALGITDLLKDDIIQIRADLHDFDVLCLEESLKDANATMQMLIDNITEIEYMLYLLKSKESL